MTVALRMPSSSGTRVPPAMAVKRPRGRPRKTADERDEGNRRRQLVTAAARLLHAVIQEGMRAAVSSPSSWGNRCRRSNSC